MALIRFFQTYVSEISDPNWRTSFGGSIGFCFLMGTLVVYTLGAFCHWRTLAWISAVFPILSFVIGIFSPESPTWLVTKGIFIHTLYYFTICKKGVIFASFIFLTMA